MKNRHNSLSFREFIRAILGYYSEYAARMSLFDSGTHSFHGIVGILEDVLLIITLSCCKLSRL